MTRQDLTLASGAVAAGRELIVATVQMCGPLRFDVVDCASIHLEGRSQEYVARFATELRLWKSHFIQDRLCLRGTQAEGQFLASPFAFKIETALQLQRWLTVDLVNTVSVKNWVRRSSPQIAGESMFSGAAKAQRLRLAAAEAAAFAVSNRSASNYFPSRSHG